MPETSRSLLTTAARTFAVGLGAARIVAGAVEVLAPEVFLRRIGAVAPGSPGAQVGFRMKGGRDLALGLATMRAIGDDLRLARACDIAVVVDGIDGAAILLDDRRSFRGVVSGYGGLGGIAVMAVAAWAAQVLRAAAVDAGATDEDTTVALPA